MGVSRGRTLAQDRQMRVTVVHAQDLRELLAPRMDVWNYNDPRGLKYLVRGFCSEIA